MQRDKSKFAPNKKLANKSTEKLTPPAEKIALHPRNRNRTRYDFKVLIAASPALTGFVKLNAYGDASIDFANPQAVIALNKALLIHHYHILEWDIPAGYLCPPIPGRADYIHYLADLLNESNIGKTPCHSPVRVLDIGTGANLVYPIIGQREYGWQFVAADIDKVALNNAMRILEANIGLEDVIELRLQNSSLNYFKEVIKPAEMFDLTMCNPPFHATKNEAAAATKRKLQGLNSNKYKSNAKPTLNFGGQSNELICTGGEEAFVCGMIAESQLFASNVVWFTSLISKSATLPAVYRALKQVNAVQVKTVEMSQGQKKSRFIAWTFIDKTHQQNRLE